MDVLPWGGPRHAGEWANTNVTELSKAGMVLPRDNKVQGDLICVHKGWSQIPLRCAVNGQETVGTNQTTAILPNYQKHMAASSLSPFDTLWNLPSNSGGWCWWCSTQVYSRSLDNCICAPKKKKKASVNTLRIMRISKVTTLIKANALALKLHMHRYKFWILIVLGSQLLFMFFLGEELRLVGKLNWKLPQTKP